MCQVVHAAKRHVLELRDASEISEIPETRETLRYKRLVKPELWKCLYAAVVATTTSAGSSTEMVSPGMLHIYA